jgi:hypothetical protein
MQRIWDENCREVVLCKHAVRDVQYRYWGWQADIEVPNENDGPAYDMASMRSAMFSTDIGVGKLTSRCQS